MGDRAAKSRVRARPRSLSVAPRLRRLWALCGLVASSLQFVVDTQSLLVRPAPLLPSRCGEIVGIGSSALTSLWRLSGAQFQVAELLGMQGWPYPRIVLTVPQQMPDDHSELAGDCDSGDVVPATPGNTLIECPQWTVAR